MSHAKTNPDDVILRDNWSRYGSVEDRHDQVVSRAVSMIENGQITPVQLNHTPDGLVPITGTTRIAAARLIRNGFEVKTGEKNEDGTDAVKVYAPDPDFLIDAEILSITEEEAATRSVVDNLERDNLTWIDIGNLAVQWGERFKWTYKQITEKLRITDPNKVSQAALLMKLPKDVRDAIHTGKLSAHAALEIFKHKGNQQSAAREAVKAAVRDGTKITQQAVRKVAEAAPVEKPEVKKDAEGKPVPAPTPATPRPVSRQRKTAELLKEFEAVEAHVEKLTPESRRKVKDAGLEDLLDAFTKVAKGSIKFDTFFTKVDKILGIDPKVWDDVVGSAE